jgi:hypothetical protein
MLNVHFRVNKLPGSHDFKIRLMNRSIPFFHPSPIFQPSFLFILLLGRLCSLFEGLLGHFLEFLGVFSTDREQLEKRVTRVEGKS